MAAVRHIIVCGMGGSGLPGYALDSWALVEKLPIRVSVWNAYGLPQLADTQTPVFCVSYSGNTEETLSSFEASRRMGHPVIAVTAGGKLAARAKKFRIQIARIPAGIPPRFALAPMLAAIVGVLRDRKILRVSEAIMRQFAEFDPLRMVPEGRRLGRKLGLAESIPLVYTPRNWYAIGHIWKIAFNETAKIPAFAYTIPEANHNEMEGFAEEPLKKRTNFAALFVGFSKDNPRIKKRMELSRKVWQDAGIPATLIELAQGAFWPTFFRAVGIGYSAARTIARMRRVDPNETRVIEQFKKWMEK